MKFARMRVVAMVFAAGLVMGTGACAGESGGSPTEVAAGSPTPDPKTALQNSLTAYRKGSYSVATTAYDTTGTGTIDLAKKHAYLTTTSTDPEAAFTIELLTIGPDTYMKMNMGALAEMPGLELLSGKKWMHLDLSKVDDGDEVTLQVTDPDMLGLSAILGSAQNVQSAGGGRYTGTLDFSKAEDSPIGDEELTTALADRASAVPFTATLDAQGQLAELVIDVPVAGDTAAHQAKLALSGYGTATPQARPTGADVVEAPESVYRTLNS